ncbi:Ribonuclease R [compost metagenome]
MQKNKFLTGTIKRHPDGFGFFIPDDKDHPDVYIPRHDMEGVMTSDKVMINVFPEKGGDRYRGEVVRVLERGTRTIVGRFFKINDRYGAIRDEGKGWGEDLKIKVEDSLGAKDKELVAAEILTYPEGSVEFTGKVTEVIGDSMDPLTDIKRVLISNNIPQAFSKATLEEAKAFTHDPDEKDFKGRKDLRPLNLITIDGATAKDFDDAVYVEVNNEGFLLYVAIADVSHYVRVGSAIDKDAYERGTSVYFPNYVVPMLPEVLSNGLCSLNPHVPRLCLVAEMQFDFTGELMRSDFYEAVMESKARVTYGEAQEIIDGNDIAKFAHVKENILKLADLAKILMAKRFKDGALDLEVPETELVIDGAGVPIDIIKSERLFAHRLIEEMMLSANVAVAKFFDSKGIPAIYRIHEPPNEMAIRMLEKYMHTFGGKVKLDQGKLQKRLTKALEEFHNRPEAQILNILTLRSMSQAKYHKDNVGHFGLGFEFYTHFTSPIRRYPDLIVHRLLKNQVMPNSHYRLMSEEDLLTSGTMLSAAEQRSTKAERQIHAIKKARFMEKFIGQEFDGIISSVAKFGVFVMLRQYDIDGLVRLEDLGKDRFEFDEENLKLIARKSGFSYSIGDQIRILVAATDIDAGQINFALPEVVAQAGSTDEKTAAEASAEGYMKKVRQQDRDRRDQPDRRTHQKDRVAFGKDRSQEKHKDQRQEKKSDKHSDRKFAGKPSDKKSFDKKSDKGPQAAPQGKRSRFFEDSRQEKKGQFQKIQKVEQQMNRKADIPRPEAKGGPDKNLLEMILGPSAYRQSTGDNSGSKPKLSKKLMFAEQSKLRDNDEYSEKNSDTLKDERTNRKNPKERSKTKNDSRGVRKTRVSQGRGKGKAR